jgi:hypothetical protein
VHFEAAPGARLATGLGSPGSGVLLKEISIARLAETLRGLTWIFTFFTTFPFLFLIFLIRGGGRYCFSNRSVSPMKGEGVLGAQ